MKKFFSFTLSLVAAVFVVCSLASCEAFSVEGTWKAKTADVAKWFGEDNDFEFSGASAEVVIDPSTYTQTLKATISAEIEEGTGMKMNVPVEITAKFSYTREGDLLKLNFLNCNVKYGDVSLNTEARQALEANGLSMADFKKEMRQNLKEQEQEVKKEVEKEFKDDGSVLIKTLEENKLVLEDKDGETEYIRVK